MDYGCIGEHLSHSFSKILHSKIGDYSYDLKELSKENLDSFMKEKDFKAINVTIPYKVDVIPYLNSIDKKAKEIGAVNTIVKSGDKLIGYNTDFDGMTALINKLGLSLKNKNVLILGTGGTSKTAYYVSKYLGAKKITKVSRSKKENTITYDEATKDFNDTNIIINTTPCGMYPKTDASPIDLTYFNKLEGVIDAIYNPLNSRLVLEAKSRNIKSSGGLYMLTAQAVFAAEKFFSMPIPNEIIDKVYSEILKEKQNIVLVGMPGSGKTTLSSILAKKLNKNFLDTDDLICKQCGETPQNIITTKGIEFFRSVESKIIEKISSQSNCVISTGGGAVLDNENIFNLKLNGKIYFIDRDINNIIPTSDRPLSSNKEKLVALYGERYEIYKAVCDQKVENNKSEMDAINTIIADFERIE